jgi:UDP-glucose 4-epimerase
MKALQAQSNIKSFEIFNIGSGKAVTVLDLIKSFEKTSGALIRCKIFPRRDGDLPKFWADSTLASELINWKPKFDVDKMCEDTWRWQINNINGYDLLSAKHKL